MSGLEDLVSGERIAERIARMAEIGSLPNGAMNRLPYTPEDRKARELFMTWLDDLGLNARIDGAGNAIGRLEGTDPMAPIVMSGSHLDTLPSTGQYDGIAGVVAALEVAHAMREAEFTHRHPIEIVDFAAEEVGVRFDLPMVGSAAMIGALEPDALEARCRLTGLTLREALRSVGVDPEKLLAATRPQGSIKAMVELHIEQGPYLERAGKQIGVVADVAGSTRIQCVLKGQQAHAGGMPMDSRRDALCGAAEVVLATEDAGKKRSSPPVVATVVYITLKPEAAAGIIPGHVEMRIDVRAVDLTARDEVVSSIKSAVNSIAQRRKLEYEWKATISQPPVKMAPEIVSTIVRACEEFKLSYQLMPSGGGHDAMTIGRRFPSGMLFVPSVSGISHAPEEFTRNEDLVAGAKVLCRTLSVLAQ